MKQHLRVSIVIPNWNGVFLMEKHLPKVIAAAGNAEVIVSDDASVDGSVEWLHKHFPRVKVVVNRKRQGFAGNVNCGVAAATGDIVVLLNTDVEPEKEFLAPLLVHFAEAKVFAVGCLEKSFDSGGVVLRGRGIARWTKGFFIHSRGEVNKTDTAWVSGGSGAFRKKIWDELGGMDTLYNPFYWEDIDLSYRALKAGYKLVFEPKSIIRHYHEQGKIKSEFSPDEVKRIAYRNQFTFVWKNLSDRSLMLMHSLFIPIRLVKAVLRGDFAMVKGYALALMRLGHILASRHKSSLRWRKRDGEIFRS